MEIEVSVPDNDMFTAAAIISGKSGSTNNSNLRSTREQLEPAHGGNTNSISVWFTWTAPTNGQVCFSTTNTVAYGGAFNSVLAVYIGEGVTNLTEITNHHGGSKSSQVVFYAGSNTTYHIAVAGCNNTMGDFTLAWQQSVLPLFFDHPQSTNVVAGESVTFFSLAIGEPPPTYQWLSNGVSIVIATNAYYTLTDAEPTLATNKFWYSAIASNSFGTATSQVALLVVHDSATAKITNTSFTVEGYFVMHVHGVTNRPYTVESTTNLNGSIQWMPVFTNYVSFNYTNFLTSNDVARFYRVLAGPME